MLRFFFILLLMPVYAAIGQSIQIPGIPHPATWENQPKSFKLISGSLVVESGPKTDMFRDPNVTYNTDNAPKLLFTPGEDFVLSAAIEHAFTSKWDGGALVLKIDSLNWIKCCFEKDYTGAHRVVSVVTKDISDDCNSIAVPGNKVWFKLAKAGKVITFYCSTDGKKWLLVRHLQMQGLENCRVGFLSQSPTGNNCRVRFSNIRYQAVTIKDPYAGE